MLGFRPLSVSKRKQKYNEVPNHDLEDGDYDEKRYDSDDESYVSSADSTPYASRAASATHPPRRRSISKPAVSAYSYRNPRAFTRYLGLAVGTTLLLFMLFLTNASVSSIKNVQLGLKKPPPPPRVWEAFPFLKRYHGGIRTLTPREKNVPEYPTKQDIDPDAPESDNTVKKAKEKRADGSKIPPSEEFNPFPDYKSIGYVDIYGPVEPCYLDDKNTIKIPPMQAYKGVTAGTPDNVMGSYELFGLRDDVCFERFGRLGPYGLGYSRKYGGTGAALEGDREGIEKVWRDVPEVDYRNVNWGEVTRRCFEKNKARFKPAPAGRGLSSIKEPTEEKDVKDNKEKREEVVSKPAVDIPATEVAESPTQTPVATAEKLAKENVEKTAEKAAESVAEKPTIQAQPKAEHRHLLPRTAVLIRTWWDYNYDDEDLLFLRSLIAELSIQSGGEYDVHFLVHVKDDDKQIWGDEEVYQEVLKKSLPKEFWGMGTLWSERQMFLIYGGMDQAEFRNLPLYGNYRSTFMPVSYFAYQHPEYDHFWHWEMDVRYTGHYYHLFDKISKWASKQPRKGLWERNSRFYVPAVHGSWEDFSQMVRVQTEHGTNSQANKWSSHLPPNPKMPHAETLKPEKPIWGPEIPEDYPDIEIDPAVKPKTTMTEDKHTWGVDEEADLIVFNPLFDPDKTNWILAEDVTGYNRTRGFPPRRTAINTSGRLSRRLLLTMHREQTIHRHTMFSEMWPASCALHHGLKAVYAPHPVFIDRKWPVQYLAAIFNNGRNGASGGARLSVFSDERQHNFLGTTWYYHAGHAPNMWKRWLGYKVDGDGGEQEELAKEGRMCLPAMLLHPVKQVDLVIDREGSQIEEKDTKWRR
ncbi:hypothetical protein BU24DRAFT_421239 [Aaosphaeria arxii CBS 175.79]|uniref:Uncharacterized protein n=1 Tax=Aaosphaeria arxii CBS 175.79 TaxID=1450172 RepID=A0A6A5Y0Y5_9PLEO|nr:uncharacterized protein BU24DRAFT_421239 [Aaosphaeria arxii CBS 175.79]KAF2018224.1 hypothetical protein BU24DRAFT_421239 [Aaosphaeria arxii CBS 175.79]